MSKQTRILVIDDDRDVHTVVKKILEPESYEVISAYSKVCVRWWTRGLT
jgi:CheY-like chemotaxis protein